MADSTISSNWMPDMPEHLKDYQALEQDIRSRLTGLTNVEKGDRFAQFVRDLVPQSDLNWQFETPILNKKRSNDEGVDLIAAGRDKQSTLYIQSRLWIDRAEDIDSILTKFKDYLAQRGVGPDGTASMFDLFDERPVHFLIATLSLLDGKRQKYERHEYGNKAFYRDLMDKKRLHFIDGAETLKILRSTYRRVSDSPDRQTLNLETPVISKGNVHIGIISSNELSRLYDDFNESLFFENLRDFQGLTPQKGRKSPNMEIVTTITTYPDKMLERNNGIVIKAERVELDNAGQRLILTRGSIVNGCQTTTCLVKYPNEASCVLVKIVQTSDPWDITEPMVLVAQAVESICEKHNRPLRCEWTQHIRRRTVCPRTRSSSACFAW